MADIDGKVAPSHTPIKALITITSHGKSSMSPTRVAIGNNKLEIYFCFVYTMSYNEKLGKYFKSNNDIHYKLNLKIATPAIDTPNTLLDPKSSDILPPGN